MADSCCSSCDSCDELGVAVGSTGTTGATGATGAAGATGAGWLTGKITIPTASVLTLFASPVALIAAPGAGFAIEMISASVRIATYGGAAYTTNTSLQIITDTATIEQLIESSVLLATAATDRKFVDRTTALAVGSSQIIENKGVFAKVATGNPAIGSSNIDVYFVYRIVTL